jgi:hypothetical protein
MHWKQETNKQPHNQANKKKKTRKQVISQSDYISQPHVGNTAEQYWYKVKSQCESVRAAWQDARRSLFDQEININERTNLLSQ